MNNMRDITEKYNYTQEIIDDVFDGATTLLYGVENAIIFGGTLRSIVAGLPINGDLDILTANNKTIIKTINKNPKWVPVETIDDKKYAAIGIQPISFKNYNNKIIQIITKFTTSTPEIQGLINYLSKNIDFICCGFCLFPNGQFFEFLPGAEEDCKNKIIRKNPECIKPITQTRIDKFKEAGWTIAEDVVATDTKIFEQESIEYCKSIKPRKLTMKERYSMPILSDNHPILSKSNKQFVNYTITMPKKASLAYDLSYEEIMDTLGPIIEPEPIIENESMYISSIHVDESGTILNKKLKSSKSKPEKIALNTSGVKTGRHPSNAPYPPKYIYKHDDDIKILKGFTWPDSSANICKQLKIKNPPQYDLIESVQPVSIETEAQIENDFYSNHQTMDDHNLEAANKIINTAHWEDSFTINWEDSF